MQLQLQSYSKVRLLKLSKVRKIPVKSIRINYKSIRSVMNVMSMDSKKRNHQRYLLTYPSAIPFVFKACFHLDCIACHYATTSYWSKLKGIVMKAVTGLLTLLSLFPNPCTKDDQRNLFLCNLISGCHQQDSFQDFK